MMSDMTELWLTGNTCSGAMPNLSGMTSLDRLKVNGNCPERLGRCHAAGGLRWLIAGETDIGETAPDLSSLMNMTTLWLNDKWPEGQIPVASIPTSVTALNLRDNSLSGDDSGHERPGQPAVPVPEQGNSLSGDIPGTMGDMDSLRGSGCI